MKRSFLTTSFLLMLLASCNSGSMTKTSTGSDHSNTWVMIVGVLKWQDAGLNPFSALNRKDKELADLFLAKGVEEDHLVLLLDEEATLSRIKKELTSLLSRIPEGDTLVFYYAGHGIKEGDGSAYFANYDLRPDQAAATGLAVSYLGETIRAQFKGDVLWLTADCCYSGALLEEGKKMGKIKTLVSTSSTASNSSTANWTFTQTMIDCLQGLPLADHNRDGVISAGEWQAELELAMIHREKQKSGFGLFGLSDGDQIARTKGSIQVSDENYPAGCYAQAFYENQWQAVRVMGKTGQKYLCQLYHYSDKKDVLIEAGLLKKPHFVEYPIHSKVQVIWQGQWYDAEIKEASGGFHYITYSGYDSWWDEWVMYDRIRTGKEQQLQVLWEGDWYPALILEEKNGKYYIHYTSYGNEWDEWVGKDRVKW